MQNEKNGNSGRRSVQTTGRRAQRLAVISTPTFLPDGFVQRSQILTSGVSSMLI